MNFSQKENQAPLRVFLPVLLGIGLILILYVAAFQGITGGETDEQRSVDSTKTAIALTSQALLGPFPTATRPTGTPTDTPTSTPDLPSATPSVTRTPTSTPTVFIFETLNPRERDEKPTAILTSTSVPPTARPTLARSPFPATNTPVPVINTPLPEATNTDSEPPPPIPTDPDILTVIPPIIQTVLP